MATLPSVIFGLINYIFISTKVWNDIDTDNTQSIADCCDSFYFFVFYLFLPHLDFQQRSTLFTLNLSFDTQHNIHIPTEQGFVSSSCNLDHLAS